MTDFSHVKFNIKVDVSVIREFDGELVKYRVCKSFNFFVPVCILVCLVVVQGHSKYLNLGGAHDTLRAQFH